MVDKYKKNPAILGIAGGVVYGLAVAYLLSASATFTAHATV